MEVNIRRIFYETIYKNRNGRNRHIFLLGSCGTLSNLEHSDNAFSVTHQPGIVTIA